MTIDLRKEQQRSLERSPLKYGAAARFFFFAMDLAAGKANTLGKAKLLEILACIPYREWEFRQYIQLTFRYHNRKKVNWARDIMEWGRAAQDNEYYHLLVIQEKMKEDGMKDPWFLATPIVFLITSFYILLSKILAWTNIKAAFRFNAEFEDHAEHIYAAMVTDNPQWEKELVTNAIAQEYAPGITNWADIFRRIGLDERDHRNHSFHYAEIPEHIDSYEGMPGIA
jgi:hypothetical protein